MASPFHRPPPFQFPRGPPQGPPSPPDTNSDSIIPGMPIPLLSSALPLSGQEFGPQDTGLLSQSPDPRLRKVSSIQYHATGLRDSKERSGPSHLRGGKPLIIVVPPSNLLQDRGQALTANNGPLSRLSQGIVMPLFPSMFGQLTVIAREFNFPSTSGLCLYYHYTEDGLTLTPRISDDSWQTLWGHLSDPPLPNERRPLISGKIEFDIDHRLARWYSPWISTMHRELSDASHFYPHTAPSHGHFRGESRTTVTDGRFFEDDAADGLPIQQHSAPITRHGPRKLSLVERFESPLGRPDPKTVPRALGTHTPPEYNPANSQVLSPIVQEDEPKTARQVLNSRVKSWRASAQLTPTPLAATGQTSLEPPNLPNSMVLDPTHEAEAEELNMDDFTWSISSRGPESVGGISPVSWARVPSVHLDSRLEGSVCSTPSIQTSCGPMDYDDFHYDSPQPSRVGSPDIAYRLYEDRPETPLTATSWGAPLSYPPSPLAILRAPSPDIAHRSYEDAPNTPMTATSWGAPLSYPPSPICLSPVSSLDLGERSTFDDAQRTFLYSSSDAIFTEPLSFSNRPWSHVWPYTEHSQVEGPTPDTDTPPIHSRAITSPDQTVVNLGKDALPWPHVWPYIKPSNITHPTTSASTQWSLGYPYVNIYQPVYPYFDIYPAVIMKYSVDGERKVHTTQGEAYPRNLLVIYPAVRETASNVYPYNLSQIYSQIIKSEDNTTKKSNSKNYSRNLDQMYLPAVDITEYPHNLDHIYSTAQVPNKWVNDIVSYPFFNIYPPIESPFFGHLSIYLYGPKSQYPDFEIYPLRPTHASSAMHSEHITSSSSVSTIGYSDFHTYLSLQALPLSRLRTEYPTFNLYPAVYPHFEIYPRVTKDNVPLPSLGRIARKNTISCLLPTVYPLFNLYPNVYPFLEIYPPMYSTVVMTLSAEKEAMGNNQLQALKPSFPPMYPSFNLYPGVYPYLDIYPAPYECTVESFTIKPVNPNSRPAASSYPYFDLYPSVYPHFNIYPSPYFPTSTSAAAHKSTLIPVQALAQYPIFDLYPAVYPHFALYPASLDVPIVPAKINSKPSSRLTHAELHAMVMMENLEVGASGSFGHLESTGHFDEREAHSRSRSLIGGENDVDDRYNLRGPLVATRRTHAPSSSHPPSQPQEIRSSVSKPGLSTVSQGAHITNPNSVSVRSSYSPRPSASFRQIARSGSLHEPNAPLPPRPKYMSQDRLPSRSPSLHEHDHAKVTPPPRKRDSIVLQRIKAYDSTGKSRPSSFIDFSDDNGPPVELLGGSTKDTLARFPMPPKIPLPPLPMDRTS